jgi:hypothetical protein
MGIWVLLILWNGFSGVAYMMSGETARAKKNFFWVFMGLLTLGMLWVMLPLVAGGKNTDRSEATTATQSATVADTGHEQPAAAETPTDAAPEELSTPSRMPKFWIIMAVVGFVIGGVVGLKRALSG